MCGAAVPEAAPAALCDGAWSISGMQQPQYTAVLPTTNPGKNVHWCQTVHVHMIRNRSIYWQRKSLVCTIMLSSCLPQIAMLGSLTLIGSMRKLAACRCSTDISHYRMIWL